MTYRTCMKFPQCSKGCLGISIFVQNYIHFVGNSGNCILLVPFGMPILFVLLRLVRLVYIVNRVFIV